ncbi:MAG: fibronectin, type [Candidatus Saccharibacteria bacterium]|nr:fibronectin, type [Candidatus Saccharibacteria bacterium]
MARLPQPGGDNGNWGTILNDFLAQALKSDGTIKDNSITEAILAPGVQTKLNASSAPDWSTIANKPAVIAAGIDQAAARTAIGAGTSNLTLGASGSTAAAGNDSRLSDTRAPTDGSVTTAKLADGSVTLAKLAKTSDLYRFGIGGSRRLQRSLAKAMAGTGYSDHLIIGDSMSSPYTGATFDFPNGWHRKLKTHLLAAGYPNGGTGLVPTCDANNGVDPRYNFGGTWSKNITYIQSQANGSTCTFTSDVAGTAVDVFYADNSAAFTVSIDGGGAVAVTPTGSATITTYTVTGLSNAAHTVTITANVINVYITAVQVRATSGLRIHNFAKFGQSAAGLYADNSFVSVRSTMVAQVSDPDVIHLMLGANDLNNGNTGSSTITALQNIRNLYPNADIILYAQPQMPGIVEATWASFVTQLYGLADTMGCPLVDIYRRWGNNASNVANGLVGADGYHPNATAEADLGQLAWRGVCAALAG